MAFENGAGMTTKETGEKTNVFYLSGRVGPFGALNTALNGQETAAGLIEAKNPVDWYSPDDGIFNTAFDISKVFGCENPSEGGGLLIVRGDRIIEPTQAANGDIVYLLPDKCQLSNNQADILSNIVSNNGELSAEREEDKVFLDKATSAE